MDKEIKIVPVEESHIKHIMALNRASMPENYDVITHLTHVKLYGDINFTAVDPRILDDKGNSTVVGYVMARPDEEGEIKKGHVTSLAVAATHKCKKIATRLMFSTLVAMNKRGLACCTLECRNDNEIAIEMYKKLGFEVETIHKNYYPADEKEMELFEKRKIKKKPQATDAFYMMKKFN